MLLLSPTRKHYNVVVLGVSGVGKTSMIAVACNGAHTFRWTRAPTVGTAYNVHLGSAPLGVWDVAGDPQCTGASVAHFAAADALLYVYDMSDEQQTLFGAEMTELVEFAERSAASAHVRLLVGTKCDIAASHLRGFGDTAAAVATANTLAFLARQAFCARHRIDDSFVCSARANRGIEPLFAATARLLCERDRDCTPSDDRYFANLAAWWAHRSATVYAANSSSAPTIAAASRHCAFDLVAALVSAATACVRVVLAHSVFNRRSYAGPP